MNKPVFRTIFRTIVVLLSLFLVNTVNAQVSEYPQITGQMCSACTPCSEGLECINFPQIGSRCAEPDPCNYYKCPSNAKCEILRAAMAQVCPDGSNVGVVPRVNCQCVGLDCPATGGEVPVSYEAETGKVTIGNKIHSISIKRDRAVASGGSTGVITIGTVSATFTDEVVIEESKLIMRTSGGEKQINILPEDAIRFSETPHRESIEKIDLREESQKLVYSVRGVKQVKLLYILPLSMEIETKIDAGTGKVVSVDKPWWGFLAR